MIAYIAFYVYIRFCKEEEKAERKRIANEIKLTGGKYIMYRRHSACNIYDIQKMYNFPLVCVLLPFCLGCLQFGYEWNQKGHIELQKK